MYRHPSSLESTTFSNIKHKYKHKTGISREKLVTSYKTVAKPREFICFIWKFIWEFSDSYGSSTRKNFMSLCVYKGSSFVIFDPLEWSFMSLFTGGPAKLKQRMTQLSQATGDSQLICHSFPLTTETFFSPKKLLSHVEEFILMAPQKNGRLKQKRQFFQLSTSSLILLSY